MHLHAFSLILTRTELKFSTLDTQGCPNVHESFKSAHIKLKVLLYILWINIEVEKDVSV